MKNLYQTIKSKVSIPRLNLTLVLILFTFSAYTLFAPLTPAVYDKPVVLNADSLVAGHTLTYSIHSCRKVGDGVVTTIARQLVPVDSANNLQPINLSTDVITNSARCQTTTKTLIIPFSTPEGKYRLLIRGVYAIIPLRKPVTVEAQSDVVKVKTATVSQTIQDLIDANTLLQQELAGQAPANGSKSTTTKNANGSSTTSTNTNTTNTTNNTTNNPSQPSQPTQPTTPTQPTNPSLIQDIIKALGGNPVLPKL